MGQPGASVVGGARHERVVVGLDDLDVRALRRSAEVAMTGYSDPEIVYTHAAASAIEIQTGGGLRRILCHPSAREKLDEFLGLARELDRDPIDLLIEELPGDVQSRDPTIPRDSW